MVKNPKIVIIGAGPSGIAAATKLFENGLTNITVLEAGNRIGGRVHSVEFGGSIIDIGGTWVHGEIGNVVYEKVKDLNLLSPSVKMFEEITFCLPDGGVLDKKVTDRLCTIAQEILSDKDNENESGTLGNFFVKKYNEAVLLEFGTSKELLKIANQVQEWFSKFILLKSTKSWHDVSVKGNFAQKPCEGHQLLNWRNRGFKTILDILLKKIPDPKQTIPVEDKILLNKEVNSIIWDDQSSQISVKCTDGSSYSADHVVVTVSLGVLKKNHKNWFKPELPPFKINSIEHRTLGRVNKIFLKFPEKWWPNDFVSFDLIWTEEAKFNLKKEVANFEPSINGKSWLEDIFGFYRIDSHPNVLLVWVVGELAAEMEKLSDETVVENCMYLLRKFIGNRHSIPEPDGVLRSKWNSNPHFCGSYTIASIEEEENNASAEDLARPISSTSRNDVLLFAGESTHSTHFATVHGAIETGYREAERLIKIYQ